MHMWGFNAVQQFTSTKLKYWIILNDINACLNLNIFTCPIQKEESPALQATGSSSLMSRYSSRRCNSIEATFRQKQEG